MEVIVFLASTWWFRGHLCWGRKGYNVLPIALLYKPGKLRLKIYLMPYSAQAEFNRFEFRNFFLLDQLLQQNVRAYYFLPFANSWRESRVFTLTPCEMQTASSRIWTRFDVYISYEIISYIYIHINREREKEKEWERDRERERKEVSNTINSKATVYMVIR